MGKRDVIVLRFNEEGREPLSRGQSGGIRPTTYRGGGLESSAGLRGDYKLEHLKDQTEQEVDELQKEPGAIVARSMPLRLIEPAEESLPPLTEDPSPEWALEAIGATNSIYDGHGVSVAVLDTGIETDHPAFEPIKDRLTYWGGNAQTEQDLDGHGTHVCGTIFGNKVNGTRIGVAPNIDRAFVAKVFEGNSRTTTSVKVTDAMKWASEAGADVMCMSLAIDFGKFVREEVEDGMNVEAATSRALEEYRRTLLLFAAQVQGMRARGRFETGTLVVAAAGNQSRREDDRIAADNPSSRKAYRIAAGLPSAVEGILSVGAARPEGDCFAVSNFSNHLVDICAPGEPITSARLRGDLVEMPGTSMAAPHVAGAACLWAQKIKDDTKRLDLRFLEASLLATANRRCFIPESTFEDYGVGMVQAPE